MAVSRTSTVTILQIQISAADQSESYSYLPHLTAESSTLSEKCDFEEH